MENSEYSDLEKGIPKKGDAIFLPKDGLDLDYASINTKNGINNHHSEFLLIEGYREAAKELLKSLLTDKNINWLKIDSKIYPIVFLIRHYIEIILKNTLRYYSIINDKAFSDEVGYTKGHSLKELWDLLRPYIEDNYKYYSDELKSEYSDTNEAVEKIINEINDLDKNSFSFRYAFEGANKINDKIKFAIKAPQFIDLSNLNETFIRLINYLEGVNAEAVNILDEKQSNFDKG